ncbi:MAG: diguanylate cyclase [Thiogranum sp.]|nr:diguanylate cyclase [Thiogranum sp.]
MDIETGTQELEQWKKKYFDHLEESEYREKQWAEADDLLRKTISRLTLAADGVDKTLDRQLRDLRNAIRDRVTAAQLRRCIDDMSGTLVKLDGERRKREPRGDHNPLLELLDALSLPRGTGRQARALRKQLETAAGAEPQAITAAFAALIHAALELSVGEHSGEPVSRSGLLARLFGGHAAINEPAPATPVSAPEHRVAPAAPQSAGNDSAREILIRLLERLSLPDALRERVEAIREQIEKMGQGDSWDRVLQQIADLIEAIHARTEQEKQGITEFLNQLSRQLQQVDEQLQNSGRVQEASRQAGEQLDSAVKKEITGIESSVRDATDLDALRKVVQTHIETVLEHMQRHRESEQQRFQDATARMAGMSERLRAMEHEAETLRERVREERSQAMTDALTGIPNRLAYEERLQQEVARWKRFGTPLVLVMWDVDRFKDINDRFGHKAGDKVLRAIANVLAGGVRETDFVARYGGEEFVQLMTGSSLAECLPVVEKLRAAVEATGFHFRDEAVVVTVSCGLARFTDGDSAEQCFERADKALYRAKEQGRNRCDLSD